MSGPVSELDHIRDWLGAPDMGLTYTADAAKGIVRKVLAAYDALLAASGTEERPAVCRNFAPSWDAEGRWRCIHCAGCAVDHEPDAGTGTPSDDGRRAPTPFECFQAGMFDGVVAGGKGRLAIDYDPGAVRAAFRSWLDEYVDERPTPAAPSGTTGATTGDES